MSDFTCECCGHEAQFCSWTRARWAEPTVWRCPYCEAVYSVKKAVCSLIRPPALPVDTRQQYTPERWSPWLRPETQPVHVGPYHVSLHAVHHNASDASHIELRYDGVTFVDENDNAIPFESVLRWRGVWAPSP